MNSKLFLSSATIFIPAYNEEGNIKDVVLEAKDVLDKITNKGEIIVINDGSTDKTGEILEQLKENSPALKVIHYSKNRGIPFALINGYCQASGDIIFFNSADKQVPMSHMLKMLPKLKDFDLVIGAFPRRNNHPIRILFSRAYHFLIKIFFGLNFRNINAVKLFKKKVFDKNHLWSESLCIDLEIVLRAHLNGFKITELELEHFKRDSGKSYVFSFSNTLSTFYNLLSLWIRYLPKLTRSSF